MTATIMTQHLEIDSLGTIYKDVPGRDIKEASYYLENPMPYNLETSMLYLMRYIMTSLDAGGCQEMFCCIWAMLPSSLTVLVPSLDL